MPQMSRSGGPNFLGAKYAPFVVSNDPNRTGFRVRDVAVPKDLLQDRFHRRQGIRELVDRMRRFRDEAVGDPVMALDSYYQQGYDLVTSKEAQAAFDIEREDDKI